MPLATGRHTRKVLTDISLTVFAMQAMQNAKPGCVVLVTGDQDFVPLVINFKRAGHHVTVAFKWNASGELLEVASGHIDLCKSELSQQEQQQQHAEAAEREQMAKAGAGALWNLGRMHRSLRQFAESLLAQFESPEASQERQGHVGRPYNAESTRHSPFNRSRHPTGDFSKAARAKMMQKKRFVGATKAHNHRGRKVEHSPASVPLSWGSLWAAVLLEMTPAWLRNSETFLSPCGLNKTGQTTMYGSINTPAQPPSRLHQPRELSEPSQSYATGKKGAHEGEVKELQKQPAQKAKRPTESTNLAPHSWLHRLLWSAASAQSTITGYKAVEQGKGKAAESQETVHQGDGEQCKEEVPASPRRSKSWLHQLLWGADSLNAASSDNEFRERKSSGREDSGAVKTSEATGGTVAGDMPKQASETQTALTRAEFQELGSILQKQPRICFINMHAELVTMDKNEIASKGTSAKAKEGEAGSQAIADVSIPMLHVVLICFTCSSVGIAEGIDGFYSCSRT
jgi:hypothetical protein